MKRFEKELQAIRNRWDSRQDADWKEELHPRDEGGKFSSKNESGVKQEKQDRRATATTSTRSGIPYPRLKPGTTYMKALDTAEHTAKNDEVLGAIPAGRWDKVVSQIGEDKVAYQATFDGKKVACIPGLSAMVDNKVKGSATMQNIADRALADGIRISNDLIGVAEDSGMYLDGLENCAKGASHIEDKAKRKLQSFREKYMPDATEEDVAENFWDLVRFTAVTSNDNIVEGTNNLIRSLQRKGYEVVEVDNKFLNHDGTVNDDAIYRAIHISAKDKNGRYFEVQVHSDESLAVKDLNHHEYEEMRDMEKTPRDQWTDKMRSRNEELTKTQLERWRSSYKNPAGIERLKSYPKSKWTPVRARNIPPSS